MLFMDDQVHVEEHAIALARALAPCLVVRGAQLFVIKRLESEHVVDIHTSSISWIVKRILTYQNNKNKKMRAKAVLFFRTLQPLLVSVTSRDALKM